MALVEVGSSITVTDREIKILNDLVEVHEPVKHAADKLCRRNATLLTPEWVHDFVNETLMLILHSRYCLTLTFRSESKKGGGKHVILSYLNTCLIQNF